MLYDAARIILGLLYFAFGLNGFFHFRPLPKMNEPMMRFNQALQDTQIIMPVVKVFEVVFGLSLLLNQTTTLATAALAPISFFIVFAHLKFNRPKGFVMAALIGTCQAVLLYEHRIPLILLLQS